MGRATRWLKSLLGLKKEKEAAKNSNENDKREKKRWSFAKSTRDSVPPLGQIPVNIPVSDASWLRNYIAETEKEQSKQAIAVAAATAAAADAAVAAAQAAVAVVRLTSQGRGALFGGGRERWAAVKIQTVFRGFLARKALRALKGLVKLQAHVRGYLVRKQAAATLRRMQSLIRAQAAARYRRARRSINKDSRIQPDFWHRKSMEKIDEPRNDFQSKRLSASYDQSYNAFDDSPKIVEIDTFKTRSRSRRSNPVSVSDYGEDVLYPTVSSPLPIPARISIPTSRNLHDYDWTLYGDEYRISTAQSTPRVDNSLRANAPVTPAKSVCCDSFFRQYPYNYPNYMANTQSFQAKLRSQSAPKQRPEPTGPRKRVSLNEIMAARNSISSVRMQRPCSQVQENFYC